MPPPLERAVLDGAGAGISNDAIAGDEREAVDGSRRNDRAIERIAGKVFGEFIRSGGNARPTSCCRRLARNGRSVRLRQDA